MVILFALALVVIVGMAGLSLDAGLSYMAQTGLQSASDNASLAAARMLAVDYQSEISNPATTPLPWTYSQVVDTVASIVNANKIASASNTQNSWVGYFTTTSGTRVCQFWPKASATCSGLPLLPDTNVLAVNGAQVVPVNTHNTNLLNVLGISTATETAPATAIFGVNQGISEANFAVFQADCLTNAKVALGDRIVYYGPSWQKAWSCDNIGDNQFKGDLHSVAPSPLLVPGWASSVPGSGNITTPVSSGQTILIPMIDCISLGSQCTEPPPPSCTPTLPSSLSVSGNDVMCVVGLLAVKALGTGKFNAKTGTITVTDPTATCKTGSTCIGEVVPFVSGQSNVLICPTNLEPSCGSLSANQGPESLSIELLH